MSNDLVERLRFKAQVAYGFNASYGRKGKDWAIETEIEWQAADHIEAQSKLIEEMREALEAIYRHIDSPENYDRHIDAICDSTLSKAKSQQEGETE